LNVERSEPLNVERSEPLDVERKRAEQSKWVTATV
jgi:hypothetical protein